MLINGLVLTEEDNKELTPEDRSARIRPLREQLAQAERKCSSLRSQIMYLEQYCEHQLDEELEYCIICGALLYCTIGDSCCSM